MRQRTQWLFRALVALNGIDVLLAGGMVASDVFDTGTINDMYSPLFLAVALINALYFLAILRSSGLWSRKAEALAGAGVALANTLQLYVVMVIAVEIYVIVDTYNDLFHRSASAVAEMAIVLLVGFLFTLPNFFGLWLRRAAKRGETP